ncbi:hypothetical protein BY458DRAFT_491288 [Sporodiniella umbellata]|nr:hypothetical protein BY458DRAFT_491288 [Sporodiniella umbellata]
MSDQENPSTVELPRREREDEMHNIKTVQSEELFMNDTHYLHSTFKSTEKKRNDNSDQSDPLDVQENQPLKIEHKTEKIYHSINTNHELEDLRDELYRLRNEGKVLKEENSMLGIQIGHFKTSLSEQSLETLRDNIHSLHQEIDEHEEYDQELSALLGEKERQGIQFMREMKKKDEKINELLNELSETKYKIFELQEQQ